MAIEQAELSTEQVVLMHCFLLILYICGGVVSFGID